MSGICDTISDILESNFFPIALGLALIAMTISSFVESGLAMKIYILSLIAMFTVNAMCSFIVRVSR